MLGRRHLLLGALALGGCAAPARSGPPATSPRALSPTRASSPAHASPDTSPTSSTTRTSQPAPAPLPTKAQVVERFGGRAPRAWGLEVPGMALRLPRRAVADGAVALTFDACGAPTTTGPGQGVDADLVATLRRHRAAATFFLNERWVRAHRRLALELAEDPLFEVANHGTLHRPLSVEGRAAYGIAGTTSVGAVYDEVVGNTELLTDLLGTPPRFFRAGTAHCDDVAVDIVEALGQTVVNFSVNADAGATAARRQVARALDGVAAGDIVIGHLNHPEDATAEGVADALPRLLDRGLTPVRLSECL